MGLLVLLQWNFVLSGKKDQIENGCIFHSEYICVFFLKDMLYITHSKNVVKRDFFGDWFCISCKIKVDKHDVIFFPGLYINTSRVLRLILNKHIFRTFEIKNQSV